MVRALLAVVAVALGLAFISPAHAVVPSIKQPSWIELTLEQKQTLAPLSDEWDRLEPWRRKKWLGIALRYKDMNADEQARVQRRMKDWIKLSPEERKAAREKFKTLQKAPAEHKEAIKQKWQEYKELPEEERKQFQEAAKAQPKSAAGTTAIKAPVTAPPKPAVPAAATAPAAPPAPAQ
ncbi:MAG: DUF3106 domain-containing protein [Rhodocyclales bacterium]|nr:DUF3106 domain-containing protein [Rhodocyclales bacterium]